MEQHTPLGQELLQSEKRKEPAGPAMPSNLRFRLRRARFADLRTQLVQLVRLGNLLTALQKVASVLAHCAGFSTATLESSRCWHNDFKLPGCQGGKSYGFPARLLLFSLIASAPCSFSAFLPMLDVVQPSSPLCLLFLCLLIAHSC